MDNSKLVMTPLCHIFLYCGYPCYGMQIKELYRIDQTSSLTHERPVKCNGPYGLLKVCQLLNGKAGGLNHHYQCNGRENVINRKGYPRLSYHSL